jgi:hypothetical protein
MKRRRVPGDGSRQAEQERETRARARSTSGACPRGRCTVSACFLESQRVSLHGGTASRRSESKGARRSSLRHASPRAIASAPRRDRSCSHSITRYSRGLRGQRHRESIPRVAVRTPATRLDRDLCRLRSPRSPPASPARSAARNRSHLARTRYGGHHAFSQGGVSDAQRNGSARPALPRVDSRSVALPHFGHTAC